MFYIKMYISGRNVYNFLKFIPNINSFNLSFTIYYKSQPFWNILLYI
jgi:hypothetical protein